MKLIIGLGNHGTAYEGTRHNMGYLAADFIAHEFGFTTWQSKHQGQVCEGSIHGEKTLIIKPETYMNLSGDAAQSIVHYYKIKPEDIIILSDDLDLPFGSVRFREKGRDGGQKGLRDIFEKLGSSDLKRLKFGISNPYRDKLDTPDFVLSKLSQEEKTQLPEILKEGTTKLLEHGFQS